MAFGIYGNNGYVWFSLITLCQTQFMMWSVDCGVRQITVKMPCLNLAINSSTEYHPSEMFLPTCERLCQITMETTETSLCCTNLQHFHYGLSFSRSEIINLANNYWGHECVCVKRREINFPSHCLPHPYKLWFQLTT